MKHMNRSDFFAVALAVLLIFSAPFAAESLSVGWWGTAFSVLCGNATDKQMVNNTQEVVFRFKIAELLRGELRK